MLTTPSIILSASDDHVITKLIPFIFIMVIWGISAVASAVKKAQEESRRRQMRAKLTSVQRPVPVRPVAVIPAPRTTARAKVVSRLSARPKAAPKRLPAARSVAAVRPPVQSPAAPPAPPAKPARPATTLRESSAQPAAQRKVAAVSAAGLSRWLRPATLRQQFILTEILQPPLSIRDTHS